MAPGPGSAPVPSTNNAAWRPPRTPSSTLPGHHAPRPAPPFVRRRLPSPRPCLAPPRMTAGRGEEETTRRRGTNRFPAQRLAACVPGHTLWHELLVSPAPKPRGGASSSATPASTRASLALAVISITGNCYLQTSENEGEKERHYLTCRVWRALPPASLPSPPPAYDGIVIVTVDTSAWLSRL